MHDNIELKLMLNRIRKDEVLGKRVRLIKKGQKRTSRKAEC